MELAVLMNNKAPGTKLLGELVVAANSGQTLEQIAGTLAARDEFKAEYPLHQTPEEFGAEWVSNILPEADATLKAEAVKIVEAHINGGGSVPALVVAIQKFMGDSANATGDLKVHIDNFSNKVAVATYHTITKEAAEEWVIPATVTSDASTVAVGKGSVDTATAPPPPPAPTVKNLVLTTAAETITGGDGDDSISAVVSGDNGAGTTLLPGDVIDGGAGTDTWTINTAGNPAAQNVIAAIQSSNVENIFFNAYDTDNTADGTSLDMTLFTGVQKVGVTSASATGDMLFNNVPNLVDLDVKNAAGNTVKVTYAASVVSPLAGSQTQNINVSNITGTTGVITVAGVETVNVNSSMLGSRLSDLVIDNATALNITGDKDLRIDSDVTFKDATVATATDGTIDASGFTGKLTLTQSSDVVKITGGSGNDTFKMVGGLTKDDEIIGGEGSDTITLDAATITTQFAKVSGVETVAFNDSGAAVAIAANKLPSDIATLSLTLKDDVTGSDNLVSTVTGYVEGTTVKITRADEDADVDGQVDVTITETTDSADDTITVNVHAIGIQGDEAADTDGDELGMGILNVGNFENVTVNSTKSLTVTANQLMEISAGSAKAITLTGDATTTIDTLTLNAKATSIDASAMTGGLTLAAGAYKATYKLPSKSSTLTFAGNLNASDTVEGGAATITTTTAGDVVTASVSGLTATTGALKISGVETINLTTGGANTLALAGSSGYLMLGVTDNKQTITGFDLASTIGLGLVGDEAATASEIDVTAADATGADDTLKVRVENTNGGTNSIIDVSAVENLALDIRAANTVTLDLSTAEVTGISITEKAGINSGAIALGTLHKNTTSLTSTSDGALTASFANQNNAVTSSAVTFSGKGTAVQNVTGGVKGDTFTLGSTGNITHVIAGGTGTDTTNLTVATGFVNAGSINTENLNITVPAAVDIDLSGASFNAGVDNVTVTGGNSLSTFTTRTIVDAVKTVDLSGFSGNGVFTLAADKADSTVTLTGGPLATDTLAYQITATGTDTPQTSAIETLIVNADAAATLNMSKSDAALVAVDIADSTTVTVAAAENTTVRVTDGAGDSQITVSLADATGSSDSATIEVKDAATNIDAAFNIATTDIETVTVKASSDESVDLSTLTMATAGATMALNVTGTSGLTISALNADVTSIDASTKLAGGVVQTGRSSTAAANYKGGAGADTFMMTNMSDTLTGGAGADTLNIDFNAVLGGINVDLSNATNQIVTANGGAISGSVTGFENVLLDGYTGAYGAMITAAATGSSITGTPQADQINGGAKADVVTSQTGTSVKDVISLGGGDDTVIITIATLADNSNAGQTQTLTFGGGTGDKLQMSDHGTIADADLIQMTGVEVLQLASSGANNVTSTTNGNTAGITTITGGTNADTIVTGAGAQTINSGNGNDNVNGGAGADIINVGGGTNILTISAATNSATVTASNAATSISTASMDKITGLAAGDDIVLSIYAGASQASAADTKLDSNSTNATNDLTFTAAQNVIFKVRGTYDATAETFTEQGSGAAAPDSLFIYDTDSDAATHAYEAVVLIGAGALTFTATNGKNGVIDIT